MVGWGRLLGFVLAKRGEIAVFAAYLCMVSTFLVAYLHPSRSTVVAVDAFSEANVELLLILASLPAAARFIVRSLGSGDA